MTDSVGGSDELRELRDELERVFQAMNPEHTQLSDFVDAARPVVVRRVADAWDEGYQAFGDYLEGPEFDVLPRNPYRAASIETPSPPRMNGSTAIASGNVLGFTSSIETGEQS